MGPWLWGVVGALAILVSNAACVVTATRETAMPPAPLTADDVPRISVEELKALLDAGAKVLIVDVRSAEAYAASHIVGAISLPSGELEDRFQELPTTQEIVTYCT